MFKTFKTLTTVTTALMLACVFTAFCSAQTVVNSQGDARLFTSNVLNNGGNTVSGSLIGLNTGGVDNIMVHDFADLSAVAGQTVTGATISYNINNGFANANHGTTDDIINLSEIAIGNIGWDQGSTSITSGPAEDGSVSWAFQSTIASGTSTPWVDANGVAGTSILDALTVVATTPGYNQGTSAGPPLNGTLTFTVGAATAQNWVDNGLAGLAISTTDDGDSRSRFNFMFVSDNQPDSFRIDFAVVPEPSSGSMLLALGLGMLLIRRKQS